MALKSTYMFAKYDVIRVYILLPHHETIKLQGFGSRNTRNGKLYVSRLYKIETPVSRLKRQKNLTL